MLKKEVVPNLKGRPFSAYKLCRCILSVVWFLGIVTQFVRRGMEVRLLYISIFTGDLGILLFACAKTHISFAWLLINGFVRG